MQPFLENEWHRFRKRLKDLPDFRHLIGGDCAPETVKSVQKACHICWKLRMEENEKAQARLMELCVRSMKQVTLLTDQQEADHDPEGHEVELYEPLNHVDGIVRELVLTIVAEKVRQLQRGVAIPALVEALRSAGKLDDVWKEECEKFQRMAAFAEQKASQLKEELEEKEEDLKQLRQMTSARRKSSIISCQELQAPPEHIVQAGIPEDESSCSESSGSKRVSLNGESIDDVQMRVLAAEQQVAQLEAENSTVRAELNQKEELLAAADEKLAECREMMEAETTRACAAEEKVSELTQTLTILEASGAGEAAHDRRLSCHRELSPEILSKLNSLSSALKAHGAWNVLVEVGLDKYLNLSCAERLHADSYRRQARLEKKQVEAARDAEKRFVLQPSSPETEIHTKRRVLIPAQNDLDTEGIEEIGEALEDTSNANVDEHEKSRRLVNLAANAFAIPTFRKTEGEWNVERSAIQFAPTKTSPLAFAAMQNLSKGAFKNRVPKYLRLNRAAQNMTT
eukprot:TRINITY_DN76390_c0_g1_i1.p1 TRINITY_DN76390_c0_g1~~TRINITY_DN76390_c0_g1_i1.p1  ORF type:complete len:512 (-),score=94.60 TRINITY_DN76390_c0_g1_i1:686-2221(-)